jgi:hydrogenase maturation factor
MNKALVLIKWPAMAATMEWAKDSQVSEQEARAAGKITLDNSHEKVVAESCEGTEAIYECTEAGLWALLKSISQAEGSGLMADASRIPVLKLTMRLAAEKRVSPYTADGRGCMIAVSTQGSQLAAQLCSLGIPAAVIGRLTGLPGPCMVEGAQGLTVL